MVGSPASTPAARVVPKALTEEPDKLRRLAKLSFAGRPTVMATDGEEAIAPELSITLAVSEYGPIGGFVQSTLNGALVDSPIRIPVCEGVSNK